MANCPFRFELMWLTQEDLQDKIKVWWDQSFEGSKLFQVMCKLKFIKNNLKNWNRHSFGNICLKKRGVEEKPTRSGRSNQLFFVMKRDEKQRENSPSILP